MASHKMMGELSKTSPTVWTFKQTVDQNKFPCGIPYQKWAWANFGDLRLCVNNLRRITGRFELSSSPHNPELLTAFAPLMTERVYQDGLPRYTFLEGDAGRCHSDVEYLHNNVDELFVPMGWVKIVLKLIGKEGVHRVFYDRQCDFNDPTDTGNKRYLYAHFEGTHWKQMIVNPCRSRIGWRLDGLKYKL